jgi:hypothetical protein
MCSSCGNVLFLSAIREASARRMQLEQRGGWINSSSLINLADGIYDRIIREHVFGMAYDNDDGGRLLGRCRPDRTTPTAAGGLILEGSDGVIVTIAMEGPDASEAGPLWWRAVVDARWGPSRGGGGEAGRIGPVATGGSFCVQSTRTLACAAAALLIGVT